MKKLIIIGLICLIFLLNSVSAVEYEKDIESYHLENIYSEIYTDCISCVEGNPDLLADNDTIFAYSFLKHKVKCQNYQDYMLNRALGDLWQHRAYTTGQCINLADQILKDSETDYWGLDFLQDVNVKADRLGIFGFLYETVRGLAGQICFGGFCFDFFFNIAEGVFGVFELVFGLIWFFLSNIYIVLLTVGIFILGETIMAPGFMPKIRILVGRTVQVVIFVWHFITGFINLLIKIINMIRNLIPVV